MNQDLISRDAVLDACSQSINILDAMSRIEDLPSVPPKQRTRYWISHENDGGKSRIGEIGDCIAMVIDEPTITPIQRTGRWIYQEGYVPYKWKCNQCSAEFKTDFNYCPNCGAKMEEQA